MGYFKNIFTAVKDIKSLEVEKVGEKIGNFAKKIYTSSPKDMVKEISAAGNKLKSKVSEYALQKTTGLTAEQINQLKALLDNEPKQ